MTEVVSSESAAILIVDLDKCQLVCAHYEEAGFYKLHFSKP